MSRPWLDPKPPAQTFVIIHTNVRTRRAVTPWKVSVGFALAIALATYGLPASVALASPTSSSAITYVYDAAGRLEAAIDPTASSTTKGLVRYTYDDAGNLLGISRSDS